ncbi:MAG: DUF3750 domain-containing protein [Salinarimonadaceae bacterium]|nr:MAG: DUF3750 domain-containing protein [Salinarimonadaceae bacterium]
MGKPYLKHGRARRILRAALAAFVALYLLPLGTHALWRLYQHDQASSWSTANWSSAGLLPAPSTHPEAVVRIYAARAGRWRGIVAHHSWIVLKEEGASAYTRFDKVGWGTPVRENGWVPDGRWFSQEPETIVAIDGPEAERLIARIRDAIARYPYATRGGYRAWPGPNSNTFVAWIARQVPELRAVLPSNAIGRDWAPGAFDFGPTTSGEGIRLSFGGYAGFALGKSDGLELNLLGLVAGLEPLRLGVKLPGWGDLRLLPLRAPDQTKTTARDADGGLHR